MTETRTARLGLPQWSSGGDAPSRDDFNEAFSNLEARSSIDQRTPGGTLPSSGVVNAELFQRTASVGGATLRALYRSDSGGSWRAQSWVPESLRVRPADTTASTTEALRIDHPDVALPGLSSTWDGVLTVRSSLILGAAAAPSLGRLSVGGLDAVPAGVRARITTAGAERALELRAGDSAATELLRAVDSSGSSVLTISGAGSLTSTQPSAFGASTPGAASITGAPQPTGAQTSGILAHGLESAPSRNALLVNRYAPGSSDTAALMSVAPNLVTLGRFGAWAGGQMDIGAPLIRMVVPRLNWYPTQTSITDPTDYSAIPTLGGYAGFDSVVGVYSALGTQFNNFGQRSRHALSLGAYSVGSSTWVGDMLNASQCEIISDTTDCVNVTRLTAAGVLITNAPWRGSGNKPVELRDTRQGIVHQCTKIWAPVGNYSAGLTVGAGSSVLYTWPVMTLRSGSIAQLEADMRLEIMLVRSASSSAGFSRQVVQLRWEYQISGGSWNLASATYQESASLAYWDSGTANGQQDRWTTLVPITVAAGSTFRLRMTVVAATSGGGDIRLRRADLSVRESIVQTYTPSE